MSKCKHPKHKRIQLFRRKEPWCNGPWKNTTISSEWCSICGAWRRNPQDNAWCYPKKELEQYDWSVPPSLVGAWGILITDKRMQPEHAGKVGWLYYLGGDKKRVPLAFMTRKEAQDYKRDKLHCVQGRVVKVSLRFHMLGQEKPLSKKSAGR